MLFKIATDKKNVIYIKKPFYLPFMWVSASTNLSKSIFLSAVDMDLVVLVAASLIVAFSSLEPFCIFLLFEGSKCYSEGVFFFFFMDLSIFDPSDLPSISMTFVIKLGLCRALDLSLNLLFSPLCLFLVPETDLDSSFFFLLLISYQTSLRSYSSDFVG